MQKHADQSLDFEIHVPFRTFKALIRTIVGLLTTGTVFLALGLTLWFGLLAADLVSYGIQSSAHTHQKGYRPVSLIHPGTSVIVCYSSVFFVAAFLVARFRWRYRPALSSALAYLAFLAIYLPTLDWSRGSSMDSASLFLPLVTSPLGALLGERLIGKPQPVTREVGRIVSP